MKDVEYSTTSGNHLGESEQRQTIFNIQGRPLQVAKQPNSPNRTMATPVPVRTYGALEGLLDISSM